MKKKYIVWVIIAALIVGIIGLNIFVKNRKKAVTVKTSKAAVGNVKEYLSTTAIIKSKNSKDYYGPQAKVLAINVKVGDKVKKGQVLINYDSQDLNTAVEQAQINLSTAQSQKQDLLNTVASNNQKLSQINSQITDTQNQLNSANATLKQLEASKSASSSDISAAQQQVQTLNSQLTSLNNSEGQYQTDYTEKLKQADNAISLAQVNLNSAENNLSKNVTNITSDMDGVVTAINVTVGQTSAGAQPAITVQDVNNLEVEANVDKYSASEVKIGEPATITYGNETYTGAVSFIAPTAQSTTTATGATTTLPVDININNPKEDLKIGFDTDTNILVGEADNVLSIPTESIQTDKNGRDYVFIVSNNKAVEKTVSLGLQSDVTAQVLSGVSAGDQVILNPGATVSNGTLVKAN